MSTPLVVAYLGDRGSPSQLAGFARTAETRVVAVALDIGQGISLTELKASALAAGADRCHALDVRDEFVREVIVPAAAYPTALARDAVLHERGSRFVTRVLEGVAHLEQARVVELERPAAWTRAVRPASAGPVTLALRVANGEPVALHDIAMTPSELIESVETICGIPALDLLHLVMRELAGSAQGEIVLRVDQGVATVHSAATV